MREAAHMTIADFLATAPGLSSLSPSNSILTAVTPGGVPPTAGEGEHNSGQGFGTEHWRSVEAGWVDYVDVQVQLSEDSSQITLTATSTDGHEDRVTIPADNTRSVAFMGREGDARLLRITVDPAALDWQHDDHSGDGCTDGSCSIEGEGEAGGPTVAMPNELALATTPIDVTPPAVEQTTAPPVAGGVAEGEAALALPATVAAPVVSLSEPDSPLPTEVTTSETVAEASESLDSPTNAIPDTGTVDTTMDSAFVQSDVELSLVDEQDTTDAVDAVLADDLLEEEDVERELVLVGSDSEADEFALAVDWLLSDGLE
jgi:hypothetical protein